MNSFDNCRYLVAALALAMLGCGEPPIPTGTVRGTVEVSGKAYGGNAEIVLLSPTTGQGATAPINEDGTFEISKPLPTGEYVAFLTPKSDPNATGAVPVTIDTSVPDKYWNEAMSDLRVTVDAGENQVGLVIE
ncbi:MAG: carboxypeptidase regulatory-like domain-containing protein [Maioricimonas sp. JB045]|uniref:carboxypeptidase regulatory-like domain-containing protein n=1 Tax=Maioricimonas sp. JC845 TaxID=3232138 RepID=UPI0034576836